MYGRVDSDHVTDGRREVGARHSSASAVEAHPTLKDIPNFKNVPRPLPDMCLEKNPPQPLLGARVCLNHDVEPD